VAHLVTSRSLLAGALLAALVCVLIWRLGGEVERGLPAGRAPSAESSLPRAPEPELAVAEPPPVEAAASSTREPAALPGASAEGAELWYGRVMDALDGTPIAGAKLNVREPRAPGVKRVAGKRKGRPVRAAVRSYESAADGRFPPIPASGALSATLVHPRYGTSSVSLAGHRSRAEESVLALTATAALEVTVRDARALPLDGYLVLARAEAAPAGAPSSPEVSGVAQVRGASDAGGRCLLEGLPARRPLLLELRRKDERGEAYLREWPEALVLAPGERRVLEWLVGDGCRVSGVVLDPEERPLAGVEVQLACRDGEAGGIESDGPGAREAATSAEGRFDFEDVPAGVHELALKPQGDWVAAPVELSVTADDAERECALHPQRALSIHGTVLGPLGQPVPRAAIVARGLDHEWEARGASRKDGRFELAPLLAGAYALRLEPHGTRPLAAEPRELVCAAGDEGVVLRFAAGGGFAGRVVEGAGGRGVRARVTLVALRPPSPETKTCATDEQGAFQLGGLAPGLYELAACDEHGFALRSELEVTALRLVSDLELALEPAARLVFARAADARGPLELELWSGTHLVAKGALAPGQTLACAGPPGPLRCRLRAGADAWEQWLEATANVEPQRVELLGPR